MRPLTRSCFLLLLLGRLSFFVFRHLLGVCLPLLWCPPFPLHAHALIPLSLAKMRLSLTLTFSHLTIWYFGQTALLLFVLAKAALAYLPTTLSVSLRPLFPFRQAQYAQVFPLKPASFCTLFADLDSTNKCATSLFRSHFALSSPPCPLLRVSLYLNLSGRAGSNCLLFPPVPLGRNGSPDTRFSQGTTRLMSWPDGVRYSHPLQSLVVSLVSTLVFSRTGGVLSHRNFSIPRFPRFPPRNLCSLATLAVSSPLRCNELSLLLSSYLSRIGRIENPSCSACGHSSQDTFHLVLHCPATNSAPLAL